MAGLGNGSGRGEGADDGPDQERKDAAAAARPGEGARPVEGARPAGGERTGFVPRGGRASPADVERKRRLGGFLNHLIAYFAVMIVVTPINAALDPHYPWFLYPLIGLAVPVLLHLAYVLGWWGRKLPPDQPGGNSRNV